MCHRARRKWIRHATPPIRGILRLRPQDDTCCSKGSDVSTFKKVCVIGRGANGSGMRRRPYVGSFGCGLRMTGAVQRDLTYPPSKKYVSSGAAQMDPACDAAHTWDPSAAASG